MVLLSSSFEFGSGFVFWGCNNQMTIRVLIKNGLNQIKQQTKSPTHGQLQVLGTTGMTQIPQFFESSSESHPKPLIPQVSPQLFLIFQPMLALQPTTTTAWSKGSMSVQLSQIPDAQNCMYFAFIAVETGFDWSQDRSSLQVPLSQRKDRILQPPAAVLQGPSTPELPEVQGYLNADTMPVNLINPQLHQSKPPSQPLQSVTAQSMTCWTESWIQVPLNVQMALAASRTWTVVKAQQAPQAPWARTGPDMFVQSMFVKLLEIVVVGVVEVVEVEEEEAVEVFVRPRMGELRLDNWFRPPVNREARIEGRLFEDFLELP